MEGEGCVRTCIQEASEVPFPLLSWFPVVTRTPIPSGLQSRDLLEKGLTCDKSSICI